MFLFRSLNTGALLAALALSFNAAAQGVTSDTIPVGQSGALSGQFDEIGKESKAGIEAYFNAVNAAGGVGGRKLKLISLDDQGDTNKAKANVQKLITEEGVIAVLGMNGDPGVRASWGQFDKGKTPLIGAVSGEPSLFDNPNRYVINLRASYAQEANRIVDQFTQRKITKIALFFQNDAAGRGGLAALDAAMREKKLPIVLFGSVEAHSTNVQTAAQNLHKSGAEAVIISANAKSAAAFVKEMKRIGSQAQFFALSLVGAKSFLTLLGDEGRGVGVSQVVPVP
ncbi:MAG: ABC transporter substrate-binding protein, partial [Betaproteobacteria bacterium]|nr:ABC transporter substrate-binding protein [Betaproteobacteria bacterium]